LNGTAADIFKAWTRKFDLWFAEPYEMLMVPEIN
jgi:hypothetical protein